MIQGGKAVMFNGFEKSKPTRFLIRVGTPAQAEALLAALNERAAA